MDQWITVEIYLKWGGNANRGNGAGRAYVAITPAGTNIRTVLFNVAGPTRNPLQTDSNVGFNGFGAMKMYTNKPIIDHVRSVSQQPLTMYWDNFNLYYGYYTNPPYSVTSNIVSINYP